MATSTHKLAAHQVSGPVGYLNGTFAELKDLHVSVLDRGFLYGDGCYEVIPAYSKKPFLLEPHLDRLVKNLAKIRIPLTHSLEEIAGIISELLALSASEFNYIYLQYTRGTYPTREHIFPAVIQPSLFAYAMPFTPPTLETSSRGLKAITAKDIRWDRCDIKSVSLLGNILLRQQSQDLNADETILLRDGYVTEASVSNVFIVKSETILTPPLSYQLLPGITRGLVIELAKEQGILCQETPITEAQLKDADEIWVTSSTKEIMPISTLNGENVGTFPKKPIWERLFKAYQARKNA